MRRLMFVMLVALSLAIPASAQSATWKLQWDQVGTLADAQLLVYALTDNGVVAALPVPTCVFVPASPIVPQAKAVCTAPLPVLTPGSHTLVLTGTSLFGSASAAPLVGVPPTSAINIKVVITIP